ncbi:MAG: metallophosphoesterase [Fidelibacterota bacterium]
MQSKLITALTLMCILVCFSCSSRTVRIGIVGDQFGAYSAEKSYEIMAEGVEYLSQFNPDIVLHVGDMVESIRDIDDHNDYRRNFHTADSIMRSLDRPWLVAIGDHDVVPPVYEPLSGNRTREAWFMDLIRQTDVPVADKPYYSYDHQGYHFIVLYSMENLHTDPRWGSIFLNKISREQREWLKRDLEEHQSAKGNIVLVHHPHWYVWQNWKPVHDLLKEYNTHLVIAGHYHYDQDEGLIDGIRYLVMGATGGVIKDTDIASASQEIGMITLTPKGVRSYELYDIEEKTEIEWTPRISMDRLQALSCMLDNLWQDEDLYINDRGELFSPDVSGDYRKVDHISFESLSNPIDLPVRIGIEPVEDIYTQSFWIRNKDTVRSEKMTFDPGERAGWANYSTVGNWGTLTPVWSAEIGDIKEQELSGLSFDITLRFTDTKERVIRKNITYYLKNMSE